MKVIIVKDYDEMSKRAAEIVVNCIKQNPKTVLGLATGSTPLGLYKNMIKDFWQNKTDYSKVKTINLDEYVGLSKAHEQSYAYFMNKNLFEGINIKLKNTYIENGVSEDLIKECDRYHKILEKTPRDIQVLGIGSNGHIAFNEPNTPFGSVTHIVDLTENTIKDNSRFFKNMEEVPKQALSMGISEIMLAKQIVVLANGENKAQAVKDMLTGEITEKVPASVLRLHPNCVLIVDKKAASLL